MRDFFTHPKLLKALVFTALLFMAFAQHAQSFAQNHALNIPTLSLSADTKTETLGNNSILVVDDKNILQQSSPLAQIGLTEHVLSDDILITLQNTTHSVWLFTRIENLSQHSSWAMDFAGLSSGGYAQIKDLMLKNLNTGETFINSLADNEPYDGRAIMLNIAPQSADLYALQIELAPSLLQTVKPRLILIEENNGSVQSSSSTFTDTVFLVLLLVFTGTLSGFFVIKRSLDFLALTFYFALVTTLTFVLQNIQYISAQFLILPALLSGLSLSAYVSTAFFLQLKPEQQVLKISLALCALISVIISLSALFSHILGVPAGLLMLCGLLFGYGMNAIFCLLKVRNRHEESLYLGTAWGIGFIGCLILIGLWLNTIAGTSITANGLLIAMFLQIPAVLWSGILHVSKMRGKTVERIEKEFRMAQSLARLKQSKETADQVRLLRVIERERELMSDLREREIQRTQEMRSAKEMADEANRSKSAFLAVVSHEIRTPMNAIMGMLHLMDNTNTTKQQQEYLQAMKNSGDTMLALLNDILDFEKIESDNMELEKIDFDLRKVAQDVITLMSGHAAEKAITLKSVVSPDFPELLRGDPTRIRQVLLNLISNAIKFTSEGSITVYLESEKEEGGESFDIYCGVEDTGIGISADAQAQLFKPFTQADKSTSRKYGGTGLGLAICRRLIAAMGGEIKVRSEENVGSVFYFNLLMKQGQTDFTENALDVVNADHDALSVEPMRILIIEDNEMNQRVLAGFLELDHHQLTILGNTQEALRTFDGNDFDVILTDIELGPESEMDGLQLTKTVRAHIDSEKAKTPIIALTGNTSVEDRTEYKHSGMSGFIAKPVHPETLKKELYKVQQNQLDWPYKPAEKPKGPYMVAKASDSRNDMEKESLAPIQQIASSAPLPAEQDNPSNKEETSTPNEDENFDASFLEGLVQSLPQEQFLELLQGCFEKADEIIEELQSLLGTERLSDMGDKAHELKGMAGNFGIVGISKISAVIEKAAKNDDLDTALEHIKKLPEINQEAQKSVKAWAEKL